MNGPYAKLGQMYRFNETLLDMVSDGFGPDDWAARLGEGNSAHWILGHVANARSYLAARLGVELEKEAWQALFAPGVDANEIDPGDYPAPASLIADFKARGDDISRKLDALTEEAASAEWKTFPHGDSSLGGGAHFLYMHESYHLGQIGLVRRAVGRPGFI